MRKHHKQQMLELIATLREATEELFKPQNKEFASVLVSDIKDFLVAIIEYIESNATDSKKAVDLLAVYAKMLDEPHDKQAFKKQLHSISTVVNSFQIDKIEVVFVVDSAAKSDCLLPIYRQAKADPDCIAHWIPVPLYELNKDRLRAKMMFDGEDSYPGIECTDWRTYDIEGNRPDIIFTNNGYDNENYVTQLHPDWWCEVLKKNTDCLVYIPYFVVDGKANIEGFVLCPGVIHADLVILQDEKLKNQYAEIAKKHFGNRINTHKFVGLGSPKYDLVFEYEQKAKDGTLEIPDDWREKIYNTDGTRKKVVLYNTSLAALLADGIDSKTSQLTVPVEKLGDSYIAKVEVALDAFKRRNDVVLLWRPHPLMESTIHSMRPHLTNRWARIVEDYKNSNYGIYDESGDLHRAIAVSDCYYGDGSSVAELYKVTKKPIYGQWVKFPNNMPSEFFLYFHFYITDMFMQNGEFYADIFEDYLFKLSNGKWEYFSRIPNNSSSKQWRRYHGLIVNGDRIVGVPHNDDEIVVYSTKTDEYEFYPLDLKEEFKAPWKSDDVHNGNQRNFYCGITYKNRLFFVPSAYRNIVAYSFDTKETEHCLDLRDIFPKEKMHSTVFGYEWLDEKTILLASLYSNEVLEFNLDTYEHRVHKLGQTDRYFHNIYKYGDCFFLVGRQPFVMKWNYAANEITYYDKLPDDFRVLKESDWVWLVNSLVPYNGKLILFGGFTNMVLEFDFSTCKFRELDVFVEVINRKCINEALDNHSFSTCNYQNGKDLYFIHKNEILYKYDIEIETIEKIADIAPHFKDKDFIEVNNGFIDDMTDGRYCNNQIKESCKMNQGAAGRKIFEYCKKLVMNQ